MFLACFVGEDKTWTKLMYDPGDMIRCINVYLYFTVKTLDFFFLMKNTVKTVILTNITI